MTRKARTFLSVVAVVSAIAVAAPAAIFQPVEWYTVPVGSAPAAIGHSPLTARVFVGNSGSGTVSVIDEITGDVVRTTDVGPAPHGITINPLAGLVYVALGETNRVAVLDARTGVLLRSFTIPQCTGVTGAWGMAVNPLSNILYVACYSANTLVALNGVTGSILRTVQTGGGPLGLVVDPVTNLVYLGMIGEQEIRVLDGASLSIVSTIRREIKAGIWGLALDPVLHRVFAANFITGTVQTIVGTRVVATHSGFSQPEWIAFDPVRQYVWIPENTTNRVTALDVLSGDVYPVAIRGSAPTAVAVNPVLGLVYSANFGTLNVSVIAS